ncbi:MAG: biotin transporter BioY [Oscillospiraceae bacterium]|nr:biotin transporter BioY [Oscillospiraceae bacterium]
MQLSVDRIARVAVMTSVISVSAMIALPLPFTPVPLSLANLTIMLSGVLCGVIDGTLAVIMYILLGMVGLPIFAGFNSGIGVILGPTGGYIMGYPILAFLVGYLSRVFSRRLKRFTAHLISMAIGLIVLYLFGCSWYILTTGVSVTAAISVTIIPFLPGDLLKAVTASTLALRYYYIKR